MPKPYENKEYIDWIEDFLADTTLISGERFTAPEKMQIRDMAIYISGIADGAIIIAQASPDEMETAQSKLDVEAMEWYERSDGQWTGDNIIPMNVWEQFDASEGWVRFKIKEFTANTEIKIKTRPRIEKVI